MIGALRPSITTRDLFGPGPAPEAPVKPKATAALRVEQAVSKSSWVVGGLTTAAAGGFGARIAGGLTGRVLGLVGGLSALPVGLMTGMALFGGAGALLCMAVGAGDSHVPVLLCILGGVAGGVAALGAGWALGGMAAGAWLTGLAATLAAPGGASLGAWIGQALEHGPATEKHQERCYQYDEDYRQYLVEMEGYQQRLRAFEARQAKDLDIEVEHGEDFVSIGDVDLEIY